MHPPAMEIAALPLARGASGEELREGRTPRLSEKLIRAPFYDAGVCTL